MQRAFLSVSHHCLQWMGDDGGRTCTGEEVKHYQIPRVLLTINQQRQLNKSMMLHRGNFLGCWCWWSLHWDLNLISQEMLSRAVKFTVPINPQWWMELARAPLYANLLGIKLHGTMCERRTHWQLPWTLLATYAQLGQFVGFVLELKYRNRVRLSLWLRRSF